jgi:putative copper resistance protein D
MALFGAALFPFWGLAAPGGSPAGIERRLKPIFVLVALASGLAWLGLATASMSGDASDLMRPAAIWAVVSGMTFGRIWGERTALGLAVLILVSIRTVRRRRALPLLVGGWLASLAFTGHGPLPGGPTGLLHEAADALHLLAAGAWLGAFAPLILTLSVAGPGERADGPGAAVAALEGFSHVGAVSVAALALSGLVNVGILAGWNQLGSLTRSPYGLTLLAKLALFLAMLVLACANRWRLSPTLRAAGGCAEDSAAAVRALKVSIGLETGLGALVLAAVALLGTLEPPNPGL